VVVFQKHLTEKKKLWRKKKMPLRGENRDCLGGWLRGTAHVDDPFPWNDPSDVPKGALCQGHPVWKKRWGGGGANLIQNKLKQRPGEKFEWPRFEG